LVPGAEKAIPPEAYNAALATRPRLQKLFADTFAQNRIAAIAFAMTPLPAAPIGDDEKTKLNGQDVPTFPTFIRNADPGSNAGIPGIRFRSRVRKPGCRSGLGSTARQAATANCFRSGLHWRSSSAGCRHRSPPPDECAVRRYLPTPSVPSARVRDGWDFVGQSWFQRSLKEVEDEEAEAAARAHASSG
jgi:hypothetical protein